MTKLEDFAAGRRVRHEGLVAEAVRLVNGDRQAAYGGAWEDFARTARVWSGLLYHKLRPGSVVTEVDVALMMVGLKLAREVHGDKADNRVDGVGYLLCESDLRAAVAAGLLTLHGEEPTNQPE